MSAGPIKETANITDKRLKYLIQEKDAKVEKVQIGNRKGLRNVITIQDKQYTYNPDKMTKTLTKQLDKLTKSNNIFKATNKIAELYKKVRLTKSLKSYAIRRKVVIANEVSAFDGYTNAYSISNITLPKLQGLSYIKYQYDRLHEFLKKTMG